MATIVFGGGAKAFSGNSVLTGTRIVNAGLSDDVALAWNLPPLLPGTFGRWKCDEASGASLLDDSGNAQHLGLSGSYSRVAGYMAASAVDLDSSGLASRTVNMGTAGDPWTFEMWGNFDFSTLPVGGAYREWFALGLSNAGRVRVYHNCRIGPPVMRIIRVLYGNGSTSEQIADFTINTVSGLNHIAVSFDGTTIRFFEAGASRGEKVVTMIPTTGDTIRLNGTQFGTGGTYEVYSGVHYCNTCKYTSAFSPHRYESGSIDLEDGVSAGQRTLSSVAWTATTGAGYGQVAAVYYQSASGVWTQIGGANPTSPLTGTWAIPAGLTESVRFSLSPKADALQSETPVLLTATLEIAAAFAGTGRVVTPYRLGPRLLPIGGLL